MTDRMVLKWTVAVDDQPHKIGPGQIVHVACQNPHDPAHVQVWTIEHRYDGTAKPRRRVQVFGTGQPLPYFAEHLGTALAAGGALVWHLFSLPNPHEDLAMPAPAAVEQKESV